MPIYKPTFRPTTSLEGTRDMAEEQYLEPTRGAQVIVLVVLILTALFLATLEPVLNYLTPSESAPLEELERGGRLLELLWLAFFVAAVFLSLIWMAYFLRLGYRTFEFGSFPPPGAMVLARTRVRTGREAKISGWLAVSFGLLMVVPAVALGYLVWLLASAL